jgi:hypothetical protein
VVVGQRCDMVGLQAHLLQPVVVLRPHGAQALPWSVCRRVNALTVLTRKCLLNVDHLSRTRLHKPALPLPRPFQPVLRLDLSLPLQIALVARYNLDGRRLAIVYPALLLHVDHLHEVFERIERVRLCDVIHEEEGVRVEVGCGPESAVFFLASRVGEHEVVGCAVYGARYRIRVL